MQGSSVSLLLWTASRYAEYIWNSFSDMHMPTVSKLEVLGSTTCAGEYVFLRSFCCQLRCKTMGAFPLPSDPLDRIRKNSGIINLRAEVNFMLSTRSFMEVQKPILLFKILCKRLIILIIYWKYWFFFLIFTSHLYCCLANSFGECSRKSWTRNVLGSLQSCL